MLQKAKNIFGATLEQLSISKCSSSLNKLNSLLSVNLHFLLDVLLSLSCVSRSDHLMSTHLDVIYIYFLEQASRALPNRIYYDFMALKTMDSRRLRL